MAIGVDLSVIVTSVRLELGHSDNVATGQNYDSSIKHHINAEYERLWYDWDWPHLWGSLTNGWFDKVLAAGERYYDYPAGMDPLTIKNVWYQWGEVWMPVARGISPDHYNSFNSDDDTVRSDPVVAWRPHTQTQFEVWPIPSTDALTLRFEARKAFAKLVNATDECQLDDQLVYLYTAAKIKSTRKGENGYGGTLAKWARRHYAMLKYAGRVKKNSGFAPQSPAPGEELPRVTVVRVEV